MQAWFSEERMQQLGYFSLFIARERRTEDVEAFQASKALRNCTMSTDYFYPCHYFPPQMHISEILRLHVQVRAVGSGTDNVADRNRT